MKFSSSLLSVNPENFGESRKYSFGNIFNILPNLYRTLRRKASRGGDTR